VRKSIGVPENNNENYGYKYPAIKVVVDIIIDSHILKTGNVVRHHLFTFGINAEEACEHCNKIKPLAPKNNKYFYYNSNNCKYIQDGQNMMEEQEELVH
jgi:hypothetical protein